MKNKGMLFILMGLLLSLLLLGFAFKINSQYLKAENKTFSSTAIDQMKYKYDNINYVKDFYKEDPVKTFFERFVPFNYSIDGNKISFTQNLPLKEANLRGFFDFINAYKIFAESTDSIINDPIEVEIEAPKNILWGGTDTNLLMLIKPQCKKYSVTDYNSMHFFGDNTCEEAFDISLIKRIDINISLPSTGDYNTLICDYGGDTNCYAFDYVEADSNPFIEINFLDENCSSCDLNSDSRKTSRHFIPGTNNTIILTCTGANCFGGDSHETIKIFFNSNNTEIKHSGTPITVKTEFLFTQEIEEFELNDVNVTLTDNRFNITKTNK
ncbi:MAG: hypothetical protein COT90_03725 [Candidatus Diapherotrites archaeon CG10_big_fil_rev_8_21_14_0_10_31_34]|nr:MAG: hypothetical protein COT90_03725 [Candidatus Diapherotrites archaeon CG10_big_fil_rev_8_21_14_0_10_31_34]